MALADRRADSLDIHEHRRRSIHRLSLPLGHPLSFAVAEDAGQPVAVQDFVAPPAAHLRPQRPTVQFGRIESFQQSYREQEFSPENLVLSQAEDDPTKKLRPRSLSHHLSQEKVPSRLWLKIQAHWWRGLMSFAMNYIPKLKAPKRVKPAFVRTVSPAPRGRKPIILHFWTPPDYADRKRTGKRYPVVVDFHGGGFCLGQATDDRHWARVVMEELGAVVVGVEYGLAPEHPFPGPVDDGIDAILWLSKHAGEYSLDMSNTVLSGFSAGANLAITVPLRFEFFTKNHNQMLSIPSQASDLSRWPSTQGLIDGAQLDELKIVSVVAWYPILDWTRSRAEKRRMSRMPDHTLPKVFTDLFDYSYLPPPDVHGYHCSPYTSPALAPDYMLKEGLPADIQLWLCEWDMLLAEGEKFSDRLRNLGKNVSETMVPAVPHGFDQSANPLRDQQKIDDLYRQACAGIRDVLKQQ